jgi:hypothetical protein
LKDHEPPLLAPWAVLLLALLAVAAVHGVGSGISARTASANCGTLAC